MGLKLNMIQKIIWKDALVLERHIKEAICIRKTAKTKNRDEGAHKWSHIYNPILRRTPSVGQHRGTLDQPTRSL